MEIADICIALMLSTLLQGVQANPSTLYISTGKSLWSSRNDNCILATPSVKMADNSYVLTENLTTNLPLNENVWVGYFEVVRVFEYIACVWMNDIFQRRVPRFVDIQGNPSHCFPGCGGDTFIGVLVTRCYCLGSELNVNNIIHVWCTERCDHPSVACGQQFIDNSLLSIYKVNTKVTIPIIPEEHADKHCLALDPGPPKRFYWDHCTKEHLTMCGDGTRTHQIGRHSSSWIYAVNECFRSGMFPTTFSNSKNIDLYNGSELWTGLFKTTVVYKHDSSIQAEGHFDRKRFGYLTRYSEFNVTLRFTDTDLNQRKVCNQVNQSTTEMTNPSIGLSTTMQQSKGAEIPVTTIMIGICAFLVILLISTVSLTCVFKRRLDNYNLRQDIYITPLNMPAVDTATTSSNVGEQRRNSDLASLHYYTSITETVH